MKKGEKPHHLIDNEEKRWKTTPLGVRILIIYTCILALFYLIFGLAIPTNIFFGIIILGVLARVINLVFLAVLAVIVAGFLTKKHWAGKLAFGFFFFEVLNLAVSFAIKFNVMKHMFIVITSVSVILLNGLILWYLYEKRSYFTDLRHFKSGKADKIFITLIIALAVIVISSTTVYGAVVYSNTMELTDNMIEEIRGKTKEETMFRCSLYFGDERDICYLVAASAYKDVPGELCDEISDNFYRLACIQAVIIE